MLFVCWLAILLGRLRRRRDGAVLPATARSTARGTPESRCSSGRSAPMPWPACSSAPSASAPSATLLGTPPHAAGMREPVLALPWPAAAWAPTPGAVRVVPLHWRAGLWRGVHPGGCRALPSNIRPEKRSFNYGLMYSGHSLGILSSALMAMWPLQQAGWRGVIGVGAVPERCCCR
ncbi:hypothetical protein ACTMU2_36755 [Cupriavidus basilensis]